MDPGSFASGLLTGLREGVEAALVVSIVLAFLTRTGRGDQAKRVWLGVGAGVSISIAASLVLFSTIGRFAAPVDQIFEGATMIVAAGVLTAVLLWMRLRGNRVKGDLRVAVDRVFATGGSWGLVVLAFTAVVREGLETSLFLFGQATSARSEAVWILLGALAGLAIATLIGYGLYRGSRRLNLGSFFRWTGVGLIFIAAGLLSNGIGQFIEIGALGSGPWTAAAYDVSGVLSHDDGIGAILRAIVGYSADPAVLTVLVHVAYLVTVLALYLRPIRRVAPPATRGPSAAPAGS